MISARWNTVIYDKVAISMGVAICSERIRYFKARIQWKKASRHGLIAASNARGEAQKRRTITPVLLIHLTHQKEALRMKCVGISTLVIVVLRTSISVMTRVASGCGGDWREVVGNKLRNP